MNTESDPQSEKMEEYVTTVASKWKVNSHIEGWIYAISI
jgi:hypothetical protein